MDLLVADDSSTMRQMVIRALRQHGLEFNDIREAADGMAAVRAVMARRPDLVITDLAMPVLDGLKFVLTLRRTYSRAEVRVIVLTSKATKAISESLAGMRVDEIVGKPFHAEALANIVRRVMDLEEPAK